MRRETPKGPESPVGRLKEVSIVVQQAMCSRLSAMGCHVRGQIKLRNVAIDSGGSAADAHPTLFNGDVFGKIAHPAAAQGHQTMPLVLLEKGTSAAYPMRTGVPFPEGVVLDETRLQVRADDTPIPFQTKTLAWWPDGSVKSMLVECHANLTGSVAYALAFGEGVSRQSVNQPQICLEDAEGVTVSAGALTARFGRSGPRLIDEMSLAGAKTATPILSQDGLTSLLTDKDSVEFPVSCKSVVLEENGPLFAVVKVSGTYALEGKKSGYSFVSRFYFTRDVKAVRCVFSFVNESGRTDNPMPDIVLRGGWGAPMSRCRFTMGEAKPYELTAGGVELFQDGAVYKDGRVSYPFMTRQGGGERTVAGDKFDGFASVEGKGASAAIGIFECWQNNPKKITVSDSVFTLHLASKEYCRGGTPGGNLYHGIAKAHSLMFSFEDPVIVKDFLNEPVLAPPPSWTCASGVFGKMDPADHTRFPFYEREADAWVQSFCVAPKVFGNQYGLRDFGDWFSDNPELWMNLETSVAMALVRQFARTSRKECLSLARQSVSHYVDIDTCHAVGAGKDGRKELGAVYAHTYQHVGVEGTADRKLSYLGVGGHDWYPEVVSYYMLTGDEWTKDCAVLHAECTAFHIQNFFKEDHVLAREYAYPLKNLCAFYEITRKPEYLQAAAKIMNFFSRWRDAFATNRFGNDLYQPGICLNGICDYYETTRDPAAKELLLEAGRRLVDGVKFLPGERNPVECSYYQDSRLSLLNVVPDLYTLSGERKYIDDYVGYLYFYLQNGIQDSTLYWCGQGFLRAMRELGIPEPCGKPYLSILTGLTKKVAGSEVGEALVEETEDAEFSVSVSRVAAFRLDRVARGLVDGDWEGYPDPDGKMKTEDVRLNATHFGHVTVRAPDGKVVVDETIKQFYSKVHRYTVPKDGRKGTYTIRVEMVDSLYHAILVDSSLPRLTMVSKDGLPDLNPAFFSVPEGKEFAVKIQARKQGRYGGARLYSPDGVLVDAAYWEPSGAAAEYRLKGKGAGVWKVERSMFSDIGRMSLEGVPTVLGASTDAFGR